MTREELERRVSAALPNGCDSYAIIRPVIRLVVEACADVAWRAHLVPPDGGSPTEAERRVAQAAHDNILAALKQKETPK